jgi:hypothetical protein
MSFNVVSFFKPASQSRDWNNQELAELYRVEASLIRCGISVETERGLSDEGDPWFVFCRVDTGDVIIHFAHIDGDYVVSSQALDNCFRGRQFRPLIESLIESYPLVMPKTKGDGKIVIHPAALLVALVTMCFFKLGQTDAFATELKAPASSTASTGSVVVKNDDSVTARAVVLDERSTTIILAAIAAAVTLASTDSGPGSATDFSPLTGADYFNQDSASSLTPLSALSQDGFQIGQNRSVTNEIHSDDGVANSALSPSLVIFPSQTFDLTHNRIAVAQKVMAIDFTPSVSHDAAAMAAHTTVVHVANPVVTPVTNADAATSNPNVSGNSPSTNSYAYEEVGLILGGSLQTHLINHLSEFQQQLVSIATTEPSFSSGASQSNTGVAAHATVSAPDPAVTVSAPDPAATVSVPAASSLSSQTSYMLAADTAIRHFTSSHPDFQLVKSGNEVVIYDSHLTQNNVSTATEQAFSFPDGSTIVLIGLPATAHSAVFTS